MRVLAKVRAAKPAPKPLPVAPRSAPKSLPELSVAQWPQTDEEWKRAIAFIQDNLKEIMAICNQQAGPDAYGDAMPYDKAVLFWYGHIADHLIEQRKIKKLPADAGFIDV